MIACLQAMPWLTVALYVIVPACVFYIFWLLGGMRNCHKAYRDGTEDALKDMEILERYDDAESPIGGRHWGKTASTWLRPGEAICVVHLPKNGKS